MGSLKLNERIHEYRNKLGLTQEELAQALGVTNQAISKWESGQCCPDIQLLPSIADYFGISIDTLMGHKPISTADEDQVDQRFMEALAYLNEKGIISTSFLQRKFSIGYGRAKEIIDMMEKRGMVIFSGKDSIYLKK